MLTPNGIVPLGLFWTAMFPYVSYVLLAMVGGLLVWMADRADRRARLLVVWPAVCSVLVGFSVTVWAHWSIVTSRSSTAAVGYIFLPGICLAAVAVGFLLSWSGLYVVLFVLEVSRRVPVRRTSGLGAGLAIAVLLLSGIVVQQMTSRQRQIATASASTDPSVLHAMVCHAIASRDTEVLAALGRNPNVEGKDLAQIYDAYKHYVDQFYAMEVRIFLALARNPSTPPDILVTLAGHKTFRTDVGMNPNTPVEILCELARDEDPNVRTWLTTNPRTPTEILLKLTSDSDRIVRDYAEVHLQGRKLRGATKTE